LLGESDVRSLRLERGSPTGRSLGLHPSDPVEYCLHLRGRRDIHDVDHAPVEKTNDLLASSGDDYVVGGDCDCHATTMPELQNELEDPGACLRVQVAGGLVGQQQDRIVDRRSRCTRPERKLLENTEAATSVDRVFRATGWRLAIKPSFSRS